MARKYSALKTMARSAKSNATRAAKTSLCGARSLARRKELGVVNYE